MIVVPKNKIANAQELYPAANEKLLGWYQVIKEGKFRSDTELKETFGQLNQFENKFAFKIPGTTLLVHTVLNFETQVAYIKKIQPSR